MFACWHGLVEVTEELDECLVAGANVDDVRADVAALEGDDLVDADAVDGDRGDGRAFDVFEEDVLERDQDVVDAVVAEDIIVAEVVEPFGSVKIVEELF